MVSINKERLIAQLKKDEGFSPKAFWDIKQFTMGYGCKAKDSRDSITEPEADILLRVRIEQSISEFSQMFPPKEQGYKFNDVRAEAVINMLFNMGMGRKDRTTGGLYSFKNTLNLIFKHPTPDWAAVATNLRLSKWYRQVGNRAIRICKEIETGVKGATLV